MIDGSRGRDHGGDAAASLGDTKTVSGTPHATWISPSAGTGPPIQPQSMIGGTVCFRRSIAALQNRACDEFIIMKKALCAIGRRHS
jgi:hypothetical protein